MAQYATTTDLAQLGLPAAALANISSTIQNQHLLKASAKMDSYLRPQHTLPLDSPYPDEVIDACVTLAAYSLLTFRGFRPDDYDANFRLQYEDTIRWLEQLSRGAVHLCDEADATDANEGRPRVISRSYYRTTSDTDETESRGW